MLKAAWSRQLRPMLAWLPAMIVFRRPTLPAMPPPCDGPDMPVPAAAEFPATVTCWRVADDAMSGGLKAIPPPAPPPYGPLPSAKLSLIVVLVRFIVIVLPVPAAPKEIPPP